MAIAAFKHKIFDTPEALREFVNTGDPVTIHAILSDASGKYVLFYSS